MTSPATFNTCDQIVRFGLKDAGLLQEGDDPSGEQYADCISRLNQIITLEQTQGLKLWLQAEKTITLTAGKNQYSLGSGGDVDTPRPMRVLQGYYLTTASSTKLPLTLISRSDWMNLPNTVASSTGSQGAVTQFFVQKNQSTMDVFLWLTPDTQAAANGSVVVLIQGPVTNFVGLSDSMNFPIEWGTWLHWALAAEVCTGQPEAVIQRCEQRAERFRQQLENWDVEDAPTQFVPDMQRASPYMNRFV